MSDYRKLLSLLQKELSYQQQILSLLTKEQTAIVKLNQEELDNYCREKEKLVTEAIGLEQERQAVFQQLPIKTGTDDSPTLKFKDVLSHCPDPQVRRQLSKTGDELRMVSLTVKKLNDSNGALIKNCLGLIGSTIAIMRSHPGVDLPTYSQKGKLTSPNQDPAFSGAKNGFTRAA